MIPDPAEGDDDGPTSKADCGIMGRGHGVSDDEPAAADERRGFGGTDVRRTSGK